MSKYIIKSDELRMTPYEGGINLPDLQKAVDGYIEVVHFPSSILVVDEEGALKNKPSNVLATRLAGTHIVGDAVLLTTDDMKEFLE